MREWFRVVSQGEKGGGEILIFGPVGRSFLNDEAVGSRAFVEALEGLASAGPGAITVRINSPGGSVPEGTAIYSAIRKYKDRVTTVVDGWAASIASLIALAGGEVRMAQLGQFMIHNPGSIAMGESKDFRKIADFLDHVRSTMIEAYAAKSGKDSGELGRLMDETTWFSAREAREAGFVDQVVDGGEVVTASGEYAFWRAVAEGRPVAGNGEGGSLNGELAPSAPGGLGGQSGQGGLSGQSRPGGTAQTGMSASLGGNDAGVAPAKEETVVMGLTTKEIKAACPGAGSDFVLEMVEASEGNEKLTISDVQAKFIAAQNKALEDERKARADAEAEAKEKAEAEAKAKADAEAAAEKKKGGGGPGVQPLGADASGDDDGSDGVGDPIGAWEEKVEALVKRGKTKRQAVVALAGKEPELHAQYVAAYNEANGRPGCQLAV